MEGGGSCKARGVKEGFKGSSIKKNTIIMGECDKDNLQPANVLQVATF